jgi:hypothetical protein
MKHCRRVLSGRLPALVVAIAPLWVSAALAEPPPGNLGQLQQINRASEADLRRMQPPASAAGRDRSNGMKSINRIHKSELRRLQDRQRRELLLLNQRSRAGAIPGPADSLRGRAAQSRFQRQQQYQLNRFRMQR